MRKTEKTYVNKSCNHKFEQVSSCSPNRCILCGIIVKENYNKVKEMVIAKTPEISN